MTTKILADFQIRISVPLSECSILEINSKKQKLLISLSRSPSQTHDKFDLPFS